MDLGKSIASQTDFALHIAKHVGAKHAANSNLALSPLSLHVILSLVAAGSKGRTLQQLSSFLKSDGTEELNSLSSQIIALVLADGSPSGGPKVSFANGIWVDQSLPLKPSFKEVLVGTYRAEAKPVDFQTKAVEVITQVNSWAEKETGGLIKDLLPPGSVDQSTRLVLGNALYFKGTWTEKFDASKSKDSEFHLLDGNSVQVPFMTSETKQFVSSFNGFKALRLSYKQGEDRRQFSMYLFLPDASDGLWSLADKLSESGFLDQHLPMQKAAIGDFRIPRFKISFGFEASAVLKDLGLVLPFDEEGDLTEMVDPAVGQKLHVSSIFQKSFIEVNEEGTEAAAASAAVIKLRSLAMGPVDFVADHPFVFVVREDMTGVVMFTGHVLNPLLSV